MRQWLGRKVYKNVFLCKFLLQFLLAGCTSAVVWPTATGLGNFFKNLLANLATELLTHYVDLVVFRLFTVCKISNLLRVETVLPTSESRYPSFTWLLGNHSDELTPWIPVMAALTSAASKFFVLPCCPFTFTGKFVKKNAKVSQYRDYLDYVRGVGSACGFEMEEDRLRIPSTKRICFVGRSRIKHGADQETQMQTILDMIPAEENSDENSEKRQKMDNKFVPRPAEIKVRNCTRIEQSVKEEILDIVLKRLLERRNHYNVCVCMWNLYFWGIYEAVA